jgi:spore germination protein KA
MTTLINLNFIAATIIWRNLLLMGAAFLGFYGFFMVLIVLYMYLISIRSFGVPYMMNVTRALNHDGQDAWIRAPWWVMTLRPKIIAAKNLVRQSPRKGKDN